MKNITLRQAKALLKRIYTFDKKMQLEKTETLFQLAKEARGGVIVELGTFQGFGAATLAFGSLAGGGGKVHTFDDYVGKRGWAGEPYGRDDFVLFQKNIQKLQDVTTGLTDLITVHIQDFKSGAQDWSFPVSLLFWDGGNFSIREEVLSWEPHVIIGGIIAMRDTLDYRMGADKLANYLLRDHVSRVYTRHPDKPGGILILERIS